MAGLSVTSAEYQKAVGHFAREAQRAPVTITNHGRDALVLISAAEYMRLKRRDREVLTMADMTDEDRAAVAAATPSAEAEAFNHEYEG